MAILIRDDAGGQPTVAPTQPPVAQVPVQPPVIAPVQPPTLASSSPSGSGDEGARGLPQQGVGAIGPIVEPHPQEPPPVASPTPTAPPVTVDVPPDHRGLPQPGDQPGDVGPIVKPHGEPSPSEPGTTTTTTGGGGGGTSTGGDSTRSLASAFAPDHRDQAAKTWLHFQQFFSTMLPHTAQQVTAARRTLPKVVR